MRLHGYDYTQAGGYFITFHTQGWVHFFGEVRDGEMIVNNLGCIAKQSWLDLPNHYSGIELDEFVIMPNHFHSVVFINGSVETKSKSNPNMMLGAGLSPAPAKDSGFASRTQYLSKPISLSEIIRAFKSFSSREINKHCNSSGRKIWHRDFYDRIIRNAEELDRIRLYICFNPVRFHPNLPDI